MDDIIRLAEVGGGIVIFFFLAGYLNLRATKKADARKAEKMKFYRDGVVDTIKLILRNIDDRTSQPLSQLENLGPRTAGDWLRESQHYVDEARRVLAYNQAFELLVLDCFDKNEGEEKEFLGFPLHTKEVGSVSEIVNKSFELKTRAELKDQNQKLLEIVEANK